MNQLSIRRESIQREARISEKRRRASVEASYVRYENIYDFVDSRKPAIKPYI